MAQKKTAAGKKAKNGTVKRTAKTPSKSRAEKPSSMKSASAGNVSGKNRALLVLVILVLVTVIAFLLLQKPSDSGKNEKTEPGKTSVQIFPPAEKTADSDRKSGQNTSHGKEEKTVSSKNEEAVSEKTAVNVWFLQFNEKTEKISLVPAKRTVSSASVLKETMQALFAGPTSYESGRDIITALPTGMKPGNVKIQNRTAWVDLPSALEYGADGDILMNRIDQIVYTATQFDDVDSVMITIDGKRKSSLGSDGLSIQGPLKRQR